MMPLRFTMRRRKTIRGCRAGNPAPSRCPSCRRMWLTIRSSFTMPKAPWWGWAIAESRWKLPRPGRPETALRPADLAYGGRVVPRLGLDLHTEARLLGNLDEPVPRGEGILQHGRPIALVEALAALLNPHIGRRGGEVCGRVEQQRSAGGVGGHRELVGVRHIGDLAGFGETAAPGHIEHHEFCRARGQELFELHLARHALADIFIPKPGSSGTWMNPSRGARGFSSMA